MFCSYKCIKTIFVVHATVLSLLHLPCNKYISTSNQRFFIALFGYLNLRKGEQRRVIMKPPALCLLLLDHIALLFHMITFALSECK